MHRLSSAIWPASCWSSILHTSNHPLPSNHSIKEWNAHCLQKGEWASHQCNPHRINTLLIYSNCSASRQKEKRQLLDSFRHNSCRAPSGEGLLLWVSHLGQWPWPCSWLWSFIQMHNIYGLLLHTAAAPYQKPIFPSKCPPPFLSLFYYICIFTRLFFSHCHLFWFLFYGKLHSHLSYDCAENGWSPTIQPNILNRWTTANNWRPRDEQYHKSRGNKGSSYKHERNVWYFTLLQLFIYLPVIRCLSPVFVCHWKSTCTHCLTPRRSFSNSSSLISLFLSRS